MDISTGALIRVFLILLYAPIGILVYWRLFPRLSLTAKRLASVFLAAQIFVIVVSLEVQPSSWYESLLWELRHEWNIPSILASMQLALVAGVAAVTAWLARRQSALLRFYLVGIGLICLYLALDEYSKLHESIPHWGEVYLSLGIVMVAATAAVALRSPRSLWIWYLCLLTGLAMSAAGGVFLEVMPPMCGELGFLRFNGCLSFFVWEESLEFAGIWLALVAVLGALSEAVPMEHPQVSRFLIVLPALWILLLMALSNAARQLRLVAQPSAVQFESGVRLDGYRIDTGAQTAVVRLYASAKQVDYIGLVIPFI